ncbi:hypothetical protein FRC08_002116 [Ceratobasidium sp. 394]|nr:hypothetical protein FRC08_002116 [Ceratobasidium sp. 394]
MPANAARILYFTFQLSGFVTLPLLTCTFLLYPSVKRHPTMPNNTFLWTLSSLAGSLLLFTRHLDGSEPPRTLCQAQSALTLAQPPGMSVAALTIIWKVWSLTWSVRTNAVISKEPFWLSCILLGSPYLVWGVLAGAFAAAQTKSRVYRSTFYCTSDNQTLGVISGTLAAVLLILCLIFQTWTAILVYRRYRTSRRLGRAEVGDLSVPFLVRVIAFMFFILVALVLSFVATTAFALEVPDIIISSIGPVIFLIFASQKDVLVAWKIIRPRSRFIDSEAAGTEPQDRQSIHEQIPPLSPFSPLSPLGMTPEPFQTSSLSNLPTASRNVNHLLVHSNRTEPSPTKYRFDGSVGDESLQSSPAFHQ